MMSQKRLNQLDAHTATVVKSYVLKALDNASAPESARNAVLNEVNSLVTRIVEAKAGVKPGTFKPVLRTV